MIARKILVAVVVIGAGASLCSRGAAQTPASRAEETKREVLAWLDSFARYQVLFHADDVKKLRDRVAAMSPEEAVKWWEKTAPQRKVLTSPEWSETESWLRKFLDVQARYSDEDIRYFQSDAATKAKESGGSLQEVLDRVTQARRKLIAGSKAAEETRQLQLAANESYRQEEVRRREEARRQSNAPPAATLPAPTAARQFPTRYNDPLVDSLDVARWAILQQIYPRW